MNTPYSLNFVNHVIISDLFPFVLNSLCPVYYLPYCFHLFFSVVREAIFFAYGLADIRFLYL